MNGLPSVFAWRAEGYLPCTFACIYLKYAFHKAASASLVKASLMRVQNRLSLIESSCIPRLHASQSCTIVRSPSSRVPSPVCMYACLLMGMPFSRCS